MSLDRLGDLQDGVVTRLQLRAHGYGGDDVRTHVQAHRWQTFGHSVVVLHNGPLTVRQRHWVAILASTKGRSPASAPHRATA